MTAIRWSGVVSEDGRFLANELKAFKLFMATLACQDVEVVVRKKRRKPSQALRGYYWSSLVHAFAEFTGEPSVLEAHILLKRLILCTPDDVTPSTADAECGSDELSDLTLRGAAWLAHQGIHVPEPERDPVRRLELTA